ncbi:phosphomannomutase/phosphoglucomutase [Phototrophicus methaneseepsis]|uniref:Phosphomannomutase/phosphoglucomutase n=1 Tax=Phototrophicus methaneseepsis TaxID=2710758 RepID=A0A7S8E763_9CHLR|nr:phosphomannomutase/phosphoglucomutase [Phototrophicus methaneseepsis]QPC81611.1 phosphomannomutase/phosphoglucomutase [Phototrophicus methaneseepsis]
MTQVDHSIFRKYDIRGVAIGENPQLSPELARLVGQALGTYLPKTFNTERVFVGSDNRVTSAPIREAMIQGLLSTGMNVTDIGEVITPTVYFASATYGENGAGVQITGSHLTTEYNGIKMAYGPLALSGDRIQALLEIIETDAFATGEGQLEKDYDMINKHMDKISTMVTMDRKLKVVVDAGNGLIGGYIPQVLEKLGVEVVCLFCEPDGTFPNHLPNPEDPEMTKDLEAKVIEVGADCGLAFDGDSDRAGFIDEHGHHIAADKLLAVLARDLLSRQPGASIVFDVKASQALPDMIKQYGGVPVMWKTGHSLMKLKMHEIGSPLGGEVSGHLFIGENYYGFDDAPLVALKALSIFSKSDKSVSEIFDEFPKLYATPEIILSAPDNLKFGMIDEMVEVFSEKYEVVTLDGVRAAFDNGWGMVRASNTQPAITLRFESYSKEDLVKYMKIFKEQLDKHPEVDQSKLIAQIEQFSS